MAQSPTPANPADGPSSRDQFAEYVNRNGHIPVWLRPDLAAGIIRHFGRDGSALIHPHPNSGHPSYAAQGGGVIPTQPPVDVGRRGQFAPAPPPTVMSGEIPPPTQSPLTPMAGIPKRSIFAGGTQGAGGPVTRTPVFAQEGTAIDGRGGGKVPGKDLGRDSVHALLQPGEAVFNKKQLAGIKVKPGKEHLVRSDQKKAMSKASKRNAR